jgi:methyl-accepting chemotaxis protein
MNNIAKTGQKNTSIKQKFMIFSIIFFLFIFIGGSAAFLVSMWQIFNESLDNELAKSIEIEIIRLEASVNAEIAIALKMAESPLIKRHFLDPDNRELKSITFEEIEAYRNAFMSKTVFWASDTDKEFYFAEDNHYTINPNDPDNYWYTMTLFQTEKYNFNINYNAEIKRIMLFINAPVFDSARKPIGLVGTGIDLSEFVNNIYRNYSGDARMYLFNHLNEITGARNIDLVTNKVTIDKELKILGEDVLEKVKNLEPGEIKAFRSSGEEVAIGSVSALDWYIAAISHVTFSDVLSSQMTVVFLVMMAVIALIFIIFLFLIGWMLQPLNKMISALDYISTSWDLTQQIENKHRDETGILGDFFNLTFGKMKGLIIDIKRKTFGLTETGEELTDQMTKTRKDIDGINSNIQIMRNQVLSQADKVNATSNTMDNIISGLEDLNKHITVQAESVSQSSSAIEEMLANIQSVTHTLIRNTANINTLTESSQAGRIDLQKVSADIKEIAQESENLLQINSVMQTIASQTNLLSMNAAIEAAHAGETGKGFAVVADEIRKLAENSSVQSKTISAVLKKIKSMIDTITKSTGILLERFALIEQEVQTVSDQESQIRNAMEEQGEGSRQILEAVTQLNTVTSQVRRASSEMTEGSKSVKTQSRDLKNITSEVAGSMDEMTQSADEISTAITRVQEISKENKENIDGLSTEIARFKVE